MKKYFYKIIDRRNCSVIIERNSDSLEYIKKSLQKDTQDKEGRMMPLVYYFYKIEKNF